MDPDPRKEIEVDPDPDLDPERGLKWIRIRPNAVDPLIFRNCHLVVHFNSFSKVLVIGLLKNLRAVDFSLVKPKLGEKVDQVVSVST